MGKCTLSSQYVLPASLSKFLHIFLCIISNGWTSYIVNPFVFGTNICTSLPAENGFARLPKSIRWIRHICHLALQYICLFQHNSLLKSLFNHFNYSQALNYSPQIMSSLCISRFTFSCKSFSGTQK